MNYTRARLNQNVLSYNYQVYGKKGDEVRVVSKEFEPVLIVESKNGQRFPVHVSKVDFITELINN